jgi:steroid delta-isomerase
MSEILGAPTDNDPAPGCSAVRRIPVDRQPGGPPVPDPATMKTAVERYLDRHSAGDVEGIMELFAADAVAWDPVDADPHVGADAVRGFFTSTHEMVDRLTLTLAGPIRCAGRWAAFPMTVHSEMGGSTVDIDVIDVMTFDEDGRISEMKAYWDMADARFG